MAWLQRNEWGASAPKSGRTPWKAKPKSGTLHWEGVQGPTGSLEQSKSTVRSIQKYHMRPGGLGAPNGGVDIAYNFLVDLQGNIFEGRGWDFQPAANGTTTANQTSWAVSVLNGPGQPITTAALDALVALEADAKSHGWGGIDFPHKHWKPTACPGDDFDLFKAHQGQGVPPATQPAPAPEHNPGIPGFPGTTKKGSKGSAVTAVQARLRDRGWKIGVDGDFGSQTDSIVRQFQKEKGLQVDGIVGNRTWSALWQSPIT